jgi:hypothetical protein
MGNFGLFVNLVVTLMGGTGGDNSFDASSDGCFCPPIWADSIEAVAVSTSDDMP